MDIQTFVAETILQISQGIKLAQEKTDAMPVMVNPPLLLEKDGIRIHRVGDVAQSITFEILVEVETSKEMKGAGDIKVFSFSADASAQKKEKNTNTSKICFTIPVVFPQQWKQLKKDQSLKKTP